MIERLSLFSLGAVLGLATFLGTIHDFLAINRPVQANILVVEGWIWRSPAIAQAAQEFQRGVYDWVATVGTPINGHNVHDSINHAELAARQLRELGVDEKRIVVLTTPNVTRHRTYACALTVKNWLARSKARVSGVNIVTLGVHARKSLVLYERALGAEANVGVIAGTEDTYDADEWWLSSRGIYVVLRKTSGYLYAVLWPLPENLPALSDSGHTPDLIHARS